MKYVDKILSRLFGLDDIDEWEAAYNKLNEEYEKAMSAKDRAHEDEIRRIKETYYQEYPDHNLSFGAHSGANAATPLKVVDCGNFIYKLYEVFDLFQGRDSIAAYYIQVKYNNDDREFTIRKFYDEDKEYALNCAREAFEYLTKEI